MDTKKILRAHSIPHEEDRNGDGRMSAYWVVPLRQAEDVLTTALAKQRLALKEQVLEAIGQDEDTSHPMNVPMDTGSVIINYNEIRNQLRAEQRQHIEAVFEKGSTNE